MVGKFRNEILDCAEQLAKRLTGDIGKATAMGIYKIKVIIFDLVLLSLKPY